VNVQVVQACADGDKLGNASRTERDDSDQHHKVSHPSVHQVANYIEILGGFLVVPTLPRACLDLHMP